ncbi:hypothetical protein L0Z72_04075 [candidate division KSB1 bacterium]|nr:hypothetical protein [candidate division KSB1 bacterium]
MKPVKSMKCYISKELPPLHLLFTEEDNVIVVRCLDFSISSHGETINEALESMNSSLVDYIKYNMENGNIDSLFDPDLKEYWGMYRELELKQEKERFKEHFEKVEKSFLDEELIYA